MRIASANWTLGKKLMKVIHAQEQALVFEKFMNEDAYQIGTKIKQGVEKLDHDVVDSVMAFFTLFMLSFGLLIVGLALTGLHPRTALTGAWTAIANIGPVWGPEITSNGSVTEFPTSAKWLMILGMYIGRLELLSVFVLLLPRFWRA